MKRLMLLRTFRQDSQSARLVSAGSALLLVVLIKVGATPYSGSTWARSAVSIENTEQFCERINGFLHSEKR